MISSPDLRIAAASSLLQLRTARLQRSRGVQAGTGCHEGGIILSKKPQEWRPVPAATTSFRTTFIRNSILPHDIHPQRNPAAKTSCRNDIHQKDYHPRVLTRRDDCHRGEQDGEGRRRRACPPPDTGRGRGPSAASYRAAMTHMTMGGAGVSAANGVPPVPGLPALRTAALALSPGITPALPPALPPTTP